LRNYFTYKDNPMLLESIEKYLQVNFLEIVDSNPKIFMRAFLDMTRKMGFDYNTRQAKGAAKRAKNDLRDSMSGANEITGGNYRIDGYYKGGSIDFSFSVTGAKFKFKIEGFPFIISVQKTLGEVLDEMKVMIKKYLDKESGAIPRKEFTDFAKQYTPNRKYQQLEDFCDMLEKKYPLYKIYVSEYSSGDFSIKIVFRIVDYIWKIVGKSYNFLTQYDQNMIFLFQEKRCAQLAGYLNNFYHRASGKYLSFKKSYDCVELISSEVPDDYSKIITHTTIETEQEFFRILIEEIFISNV